MASPSSARLLYRSQCCHYTYAAALSAPESDEMQIFGVKTQKTRLSRVGAAPTRRLR
jgi:hypothetical protein